MQPRSVATALPAVSQRGRLRGQNAAAAGDFSTATGFGARATKEGDTGHGVGAFANGGYSVAGV